MPSASHFSSLARIFIFLKVSCLEKKMYKLELVKKLIFLNIYTHTNVITQFISVFSTPYLYTLFLFFYSRILFWRKNTLKNKRPT